MLEGGKGSCSGVPHLDPFNLLPGHLLANLFSRFTFFESARRHKRPPKRPKLCLSFQISKLQVQLDQAQQELGDLECSNGMLREEVLYFEVSPFPSKFFSPFAHPPTFTFGKGRRRREFKVFLPPSSFLASFERSRAFMKSSRGGGGTEETKVEGHERTTNQTETQTLIIYSVLLSFPNMGKG